MKNTITLIVLTLLANGLVSAETFSKSKLLEGRVEVPIALKLDSRSNIMTLSNASGPVIPIPYANIDKLSYEQAAHHRVKEGAFVMIASLGAGGVVMLTKSKSHWLYIDYKDVIGTAKSVTLRLDKSEYKTVLTALHEQTGKEVQGSELR